MRHAKPRKGQTALRPTTPSTHPSKKQQQTHLAEEITTITIEIGYFGP